MAPPSQPDKSPKIAPDGIDYKDSPMDIGEIHGAILREKVDPQEGMEPIPGWLWFFFCVVISYSCFYLGSNNGGFRGDVFDPALVTYGPVKASASAVKDPLVEGKKVFTQNCAVCHQPTGLGLPGQYPPLADSELVLGKDGFGQNHMILVVLKGLSGPLKIRGNSFNGSMPTWEPKLKDEQIADAITYVRSSWGNQGVPVTKEYVAAMRAKYASKTTPWTEAELRAVPAEAIPSPAASGKTDGKTIPAEKSNSPTPAPTQKK